MFMTTKTQSESSLERKRNQLGFHEIGKANGTPIYVCNEKANAAQALDRAARAKLELPTYEFMLSAFFGSESSLKDKFNENGKSDYSFWIRGMGRDTNHLIDESIEAEITHAQEAEAKKLAESGMNYRDIAKKLGVTALSVYYALKKKGKPRQKNP
jgi:DNA-binding CsgD family transcriptional regulator